MSTISSSSSSKSSIKEDVAAIKAVFDPEKSDKERAVIACSLHRRRLLPFLENYSRPVAPMIPGIFKDMSEDEIISELHDAQARDRKTDHDKSVLRWFGRWRGGVIRRELEAESRLLCLLRASSSFMLSGDENTAYEILMFAEKSYRFHAEQPITDYYEQKRIAWKFSRFHSVMSERLLNWGYKEPIEKQDDLPVQCGIGGMFL